MSGSIRTGADRVAINYEAWTRSALAFIRDRGLEDEFRDFCGGWSPQIAASAALIAAGPQLVAALHSMLRATDFSDDEPWVVEAHAALAKALGNATAGPADTDLGPGRTPKTVKGESGNG